MFHTSRLNIREITTDDLDRLHALNSIPEVDEFNTLGVPDSIETTKTLLTDCLERNTADPRVSYVWCIELVATNEFIGMIGFNLNRVNYRSGEVWYKLNPFYWRQGYATEALAQLLAFAFIDLKLHRVEAGCATENIASIKVLEKAGMTREGHTRKKLPIRGQWVDNYEYAILEEDYFKTTK